MDKTKISALPDFYKNYVRLADDLPLLEALEASLKRLESFDFSGFIALDGRSYFPGKWTLNEVVQHIIDTERIMAYRALCFARGEQLSLPGFDQDAYAAQSFANEISITQLIEAWINLRKSSILMFKSFPQRVLNNIGHANDNQIDVLALGFIIVGHEQHHFRVIEDFYLPLLN